MAVDVVDGNEILPLFITPRNVRRSRCMRLLFLLLIAIFVGLAPIMVYRSLGVPLPDKLKGYRNVQPWVIVSQLNPAHGPPPNGADIRTSWSGQRQSPETTTRPSTIAIPKAHLHPAILPVQLSSITTPDPPAFTNPHPIP